MYYNLQVMRVMRVYTWFCVYHVSCVLIPWRHFKHTLSFNYLNNLKEYHYYYHFTDKAVGI